MDMQFGELEQAEPDVRLRPDRNKHFAVVACGAPDADELPIFADLDALRDMEDHALSDTSVELGGVLLGGQYVDDDGQAFVLVTDSLRAEHYESTKGSFKFTHETWQSIARQREQFPAELQMVGWYHTHPDWGVFLSGMDMFICDHFFNKPLDVALVIDPCRGDRGWFQWTGEEKERIRRTGGFYVMASRFRQKELQRFVDQSEGKHPMIRDTRYSTGEGTYPAPIIQVGDRGGAWQPIAIMGMLTMQFLMLGLIAWKMLTPAPIIATGAQREAEQIRAQRALLNEVIGKLEVAPGGLVDELSAARQRNEELLGDKLAQQAYVRELQQRTVEMDQQREQLVAQVTRWRSAHDNLENKASEQAEQLVALTARVNNLEQTGDDEIDAEMATIKPWWWIGGVIAAVALLAGVWAAITRRKEDAEEPNRRGSDSGGSSEDDYQRPSKEGDTSL